MQKVTMNFRIVFSLSALCCSMLAAAQQRDSLPERTVVVTSAFKPSLKNSAKVNFSAATPLPDSALSVLRYDIPAQNLLFVYQSPSLKPLAYAIDSVVHWTNNNFIKAGYGNFTSPYLQAAVSLGDGSSSIMQFNGLHTSAKGSLPFQQFNKTKLEAIGIFNNTNNNEWSGQIGFNRQGQYRYGYQPDSIQLVKDQILLNYTNLSAQAAVRNKEENAFGVLYNPSVRFNLFLDNNNAKESTLLIQAPVSKSIARIFILQAGFTADITHYISDTSTLDNNLFYFSPAIAFKTPNVKITGGVIPAWDNGVFNLLPDIKADIKIKNEKFILQAGWVGYFQKNTFQSLASLNPWIQLPGALINTKVLEQYAGFKGSSGSHFTYNARLSYKQVEKQALFVNDTIFGNSFETVYEPEMKVLSLHGEAGYTLQEKFSFMAGVTFNQFSGLQVNEKAFGLLPIEATAALRWQLLKDIKIKSDLFVWDGPQYRTKTLSAQKSDPAFDVNAGVEFAVLPQLNIWLQMNNLLNNRYERWNQFPVIGANVLAGVVYSFDKVVK
jgi:hypothetical protein